MKNEIKRNLKWNKYEIKLKWKIKSTRWWKWLTRWPCRPGGTREGRGHSSKLRQSRSHKPWSHPPRWYSSDACHGMSSNLVESRLLLVACTRSRCTGRGRPRGSGRRRQRTRTSGWCQWRWYGASRGTSISACPCRRRRLTWRLSTPWRLQIRMTNMSAIGV